MFSFVVFIITSVITFIGLRGQIAKPDISSNAVNDISRTKIQFNLQLKLTACGLQQKTFLFLRRHNVKQKSYRDGDYMHNRGTPQSAVCIHQSGHQTYQWTICERPPPHLESHHHTPTIPWLNPPQPPARRRLSLGAWCANANLCGAELSGGLGDWAALWKSCTLLALFDRKKKRTQKKRSKRSVSILRLKATGLIKKTLLFKCWIHAPYGDSLCKNSIRPNIALQSIHLRHQARQPVGVYWLECGMCGSGRVRGGHTFFFFFA